MKTLFPILAFLIVFLMPSFAYPQSSGNTQQFDTLKEEATIYGRAIEEMAKECPVCKKMKWDVRDFSMGGMTEKGLKDEYAFSKILKQNRPVDTFAQNHFHTKLYKNLEKQYYKENKNKSRVKAPITYFTDSTHTVTALIRDSCCINTKNMVNCHISFSRIAFSQDHTIAYLTAVNHISGMEMFIFRKEGNHWTLLL